MGKRYWWSWLDWRYHYLTFFLASAIVCGAPSFVSGVTMEPFCSTIVNSEIVYHCQPEVLPEERTTLLCGEDRRWNPDPQGLCTGKSYWTVLTYFYISSVLTPYILTTPGQTPSTPAAIAITAIVCLITGALLGALITVCTYQQVEQEGT